MAIGGKLRILDMTFDDHANYQCIVSNVVGTRNHTILVRVKGMYLLVLYYLQVCVCVCVCVYAHVL